MLVPETFSTERLFMRRPKASDAAAVFAYGSDKEVAKFADWPRLERLEDAAAAIENAVRRWDSGDEYSWRMSVKPDDTAVGGVACSIKGPRAEFGFIVARRLWGHGYATEAAHPVLEWIKVFATSEPDPTDDGRRQPGVGSCSREAWDGT